MKRIILFAALAAFGASCSDNDICMKEKPDDAIRVSPLIATVAPAADGGTRVGYSGATAAWINGDAIGLFCPTVSASNVQFTVSGIGSSPTWTPASQIFWKDATTLHTFTSYYPYAAGSTNASAIPLPALNAQVGTPLNPALDVLISNNQNTPGILKAGDPVALIFTHAFSLIELDIKLGSGFSANTTLGSFTLAGGLTDKVFSTDGTSTIALANGAITAGQTTNTQTITPASSPVLSTSTAIPVYAYVLPGTYLSFNLTITIKDGGTTSFTTGTVVIAPSIYAAGTKYAYAVTVSRSAITISNPTITEWIPITGTALNPSI